MTTKVFRVYGEDGHRQRASFGKSGKYNWSNEEHGTRIVEERCQDVTGTNDYLELVITRDTEELCYRELFGQYSDGIFENCRVGNVIEVLADGTTKEIDICCDGVHH